MIGTIPIAIIGLAAKSLIEGPLRNVGVIAAALIVWSGVMIVAERHASQSRGERNLELPRRADHGPDAVLRSGPRHIPIRRDDQRGPLSRYRPGLGDPAFVLPGDTRANGGDVARVAARRSAARVGVGPTLVGTAIAFIVAYASVAWLLRFVAGHKITRVRARTGSRPAIVIIILIAVGTL